MLSRNIKMSSIRKFIDIGANLTDDMYTGLYHGSKKHESDLNLVLDRCWKGGMEKMIITGGSLSDCQKALQLANIDERLYTTVGCHPTRCNDFKDNPDDYLNKLRKFYECNKKKVVAIGEFGLDYDRLHFCEKDVQKRYFEYQLQLCDEIKLPLFLHCRAAWDDFYEILSLNRSKIVGGVVHSFDGSLDNMKKALELGFYIGINGCSLKTADNLLVAAEIPSDKLLLETDCPWCEIKPSHAGYKLIKTQFPSVKKEKFASGSMVKGRNEPVNITQVLEILSEIKKKNVDELCKTVYENTVKLFFGNV